MRTAAPAVDWLDELGERLESVLGAPLELERATLLPGGASKEAWAVDVRTGGGTLELLVRRAGASVIHELTLPLEHEHRVLEAAYAAGVRVPRPYGYLGELGGREAFALERVHGETIGRRVVQRPELERARAALPVQMAEELAKIHAIPPAELPFLADSDPLARSEEELDALDEPHPAIELGLHWLRERLPRGGDAVVLHGDFRVGNLVVTETGLAAVLDWEFAHLGDPRDDIGFALVRAWRFGADHLRLGGVGAVEPFLERYNELSGRGLALDDLYAYEVLGNVRWAVGALNQARRHLRGQERSVEYAILGRLAAEMEYELLDLIERAP